MQITLHLIKFLGLAPPYNIMQVCNLRLSLATNFRPVAMIFRGGGGGLRVSTKGTKYFVGILRFASSEDT